MPGVQFDASSRRWLLSTPTTSYVVRLDDEDTPCHLHWGPRLTIEQSMSISDERAAPSSFDGPQEMREELTVEGGARFGVPSLQIHHPDGTRGVEWHYLGHDIDAGHLTIQLRDRHHPLEIQLHYRVYADSDAIDRWTVLRHCGDDQPIAVLRADSAAWRIPARPAYRMTHVVGGWSGEAQLKRTALPVGETVLTSRRGITSHHANPWLMLDAGDADEDRGEVWSTALAWSGSWRITASHTSAGQAGLTGGFGHDGLIWTLQPGETLETPVFTGLFTNSGFGAATRAWHEHIRRHVLPRSDEVRPVLYNSWEATSFDVDLDGQIRLAKIAAELGVELFVMDDGWFGARTGDHAGLGDWTVNPARFPDGLDPLIAEIHRLGMRFGLWVEPEMVNPDSDLYRAHPEWVLHQSHRRRTRLRNQLVLNFARPDVAEWAFTWLDKLVSDHAIDFLKWDMNRAFTEAEWPEAGSDADRLWIDHTRNVYEVMDRLRAGHLRLRIETCAGGGGRVDLGILARTDQAWTSDNTDAVDRLSIQRGHGQIYPAQTMAAWVTDSPNPLTARIVPLRFRFHVAMAGALGVGGNLLHWPESELREAAGLIAQYKQIRQTVQHGQLYRLPEAVQYLHGSDVVVLAWRVTFRFGQSSVRLRLPGLDPQARYRDLGTGAIHYGIVLRHHGLEMPLPDGDYSSALVRLSRVD